MFIEMGKTIIVIWFCERAILDNEINGYDGVQVVLYKKHFKTVIKFESFPWWKLRERRDGNKKCYHRQKNPHQSVFCHIDYYYDLLREFQRGVENAIFAKSSQDEELWSHEEPLFPSLMK